MADPQLLSTDPNAIDAPTSAGTWEDRGMGGKVWHPASGGNDRTRVDNSLLGVPPELAVASALPVARAVLAPAASIAARAGAGLKAAAATATPAVKYEIVKQLLEHVGIPTPLAMVGAMAASGWKGKGAATVAEAPAVAEAAPAAATPPPAPNAAPAAPTPVQAPPPVPMPQPSPMAGPVGQAIDMGEGLGAEQAVQAQQAPPQPAAQPAGQPAAAGAKPMSPAQTLNEMAIAARRAKITLSADDYKAGIHAVQQGASPQQAVDGIARLRSAGPSTPPTAAESTPPSTVPPAPKVRATAAEVAQFQRLKAAGKSDAEARAAVEQMRALAARLGTTSDAAVQAAVKTRNQTGDWETNP